MKNIENYLPDLNKEHEPDKILDDISIYRDEYGIPHIKAKNSYDAFFGQGFATAQDRLWHMEYDRKRAYGKLSELIGEEKVNEALKNFLLKNKYPKKPTSLDLLEEFYNIAPNQEAKSEMVKLFTTM